jgi:hypothetical protein
VDIREDDDTGHAGSYAVQGRLGHRGNTDVKKDYR